MYICSKLEYNCVVFHSSLTQQQSNTLDRCEAVCLKIIQQEMFISHSAACEMLGLEKLSICREKRCLDYAKKCLKGKFLRDSRNICTIKSFPILNLKEGTILNFSLYIGFC